MICLGIPAITWRYSKQIVNKGWKGVQCFCYTNQWKNKTKESENLFYRNEGLELYKQQWTNINETLASVKFLSFQTLVLCFKGDRWLDLSLFRFIFTQDEPAIIKRKIDLQYKVFGKKRSEDSTMKAGALTVSAVFQPIESVAKSGENGWVCKNLPH